MSVCLCCGKPLTGASEKQWHKSCIRRFFGTQKLPQLEISEELLQMLATESTSKGYTVPGVQKKLSLHLSKDGEPRLTLINYPTGYILKPQSDEYEALPELEYLTMRLAQISGIGTVPFALVELGENRQAYITKRIDRADGKRLAMEDFCQLDGRLTEDKYRGSYERCGKIVKQYSANPGIDLAELFLRIVFSYVVGNSDMHLKNFSLIETEEGSGEYRLSEAYDLLSVNIVLPTDTEQLAMPLNGKKQNLRRKDFLIFGKNIGIPDRSAEKMMQKIADMESRYAEYIRAAILPEKMKKDMIQLIHDRTAELYPASARLN